MTAASNEKRQKRFYWIQIASAAIGIALSVYLLVQHTRLKIGIQESSGLCHFGKHVDCNVVNASAHSELIGIPLASLGAIYFFCVLLLAAVAAPAAATFRWTQRWIGRLAVCALCFDLYLFYVQIQVLHSICLFCLSTYVATLAILFCYFKLSAEKVKESTMSLFRSRKFKAPSGASKAMALLGVAVFAFLVTLVPELIASSAPSPAAKSAAEFFEQWKKQPRSKLPIKESDGVMGNSASRIQIVEFSDFECPHCRRAAAILHATLKPYEKRIFFVFKHFPLDSACNPLLTQPLHQHACNLAWLATCAAQRGKFWQFHDVIFTPNDSDHAERIKNYRDGVPQLFSKTEVAECLENSRARENVREDIELGTRHNVHGTPTVFINGKLVSVALTPENLQKLIELEEK